MKNPAKRIPETEEEKEAMMRKFTRARAIEATDYATLEDTEMLRQAEAQGRILSAEELAAFAERGAERARFLVEVGEIPRRMLDDALRRVAAVRKMFGERRKLLS